MSEPHVEGLLERCHICGESVEQPRQAQHLREQHPAPEGGFLFHYNGREYRTDKPSTLVCELLQLVNGEVTYPFHEERGGEKIPYSHSQAVDLTREPWFYSVPFARF